MIVILENDKKEQKLLSDAFVNQGVSKDELRIFGVYDDAENFVRRLPPSEASLPVAIVADIGLKSLENGANFVGEQYKYLTAKGSSAWTALVSKSESALLRDGLPAPLPHRAYAKGDSNEWATNCARDITPLLTGAGFPVASAENDLAPPPDLKPYVRPADRIYLFSSGEAQHVHPNCEQTLADFFQFANFKNHYSRDRRPLVMYRGNYVPVHGNMQKNFILYLLRYRTVALKLRKPFSIAHLQRYREDGGGLWVDESRSVALRSIHNSMIDFKKQPLNRNVNNICEFICDGRSINDQLPNFPDGQLPKRNERISLDDCRRLLAQLPEGIREYGVSDGFMTRLHFVLTADEIAAQNAWKSDWERLIAERKFPQF
jgi:hypothetical protein